MLSLHSPLQPGTILYQVPNKYLISTAVHKEMSINVTQQKKNSVFQTTAFSLNYYHTNFQLSDY